MGMVQFGTSWALGPIPYIVACFFFKKLYGVDPSTQEGPSSDHGTTPTLWSLFGKVYGRDAFDREVFEQVGILF